MLDCGLKIAMEDYFEIDENGKKKTMFTFDEALEIEKKTNGKWRVPTAKEWLQIVIELGTTGYGDLDNDKFVKGLNLSEDEDGFGRYWSSTVRYGSSAYSLRFGSGYLSPAYVNNRYYGRSVRCVAQTVEGH